MSDTNEFETTPVSPQQLQPARNFAASYSGEHVAGTEFVIGALFVSWGVSAENIIYGLLLGNFLAVMTWGLITAPIATDTRLTLYAYLEKIAGSHTIKLYSVVNGVLFCILAGAMITVSASAVRVIFDIPPQVNWYPTDFSFVLVALGVGAVVVTIAMQGFEKVARFAEICAPWMILMFVVGAIAMLPTLIERTDGVSSIHSFSDFMTVANNSIWIETDSDLSFWHVAAFAWIANLAMHGSLGDLTLLRFAKSSNYGYFSALGMFIGHYVAWVCAGIMGAGAGMLLNTTVLQLDAGEVAFQALGAAGIIAVIIAGWTTSNPTIYRAGLAFQSLNHNWSRTKVTIVTGVVTTIISCFPFVFTQLLGFVGIMGLMLAPIGAVIVTEHWIFPRIGFTRYWNTYRGNNMNVPAVTTWLTSLGLAFYLEQSNTLHLFFLLIPIWLFATVLYIGLAAVMGANQSYPQAQHAETLELARKAEEKAYLSTNAQRGLQNKPSVGVFYKSARVVLYLALIACAVMGISVYAGGDFEQFKSWLILPTVIYFVAATIWIARKE